MGTAVAPSYANLFMADLEEKLLAGYSTSSVLWKRYIARHPSSYGLGTKGICELPK